MPTTQPTIDQILTAIPTGVRNLRVIEILTIFWQGGTATKNYSNQRWSDDFPALAGYGLDNIEARFQRADWFVELPRTTEISDDVVKLTMWDADHALIADWIDSGEGTRCRVTQYFPDFDFAIEIWWGFLRAPKETEGLLFNIEAASGLRSPNLIIPRRAIYPGCQAIFGGLINPQTGTPWFDTPEKIAENECPYDRHIGGSVGNLNGGVPYTTCPRQTPGDCDQRLGDSGAGLPLHVHYLAFDVVIESYVYGNRNSLATSRANDNVLRKPVRVVYGQRWVRDLNLLAFVPETEGGANSFLKTLWIVCEGPILGPRIAEAKQAGDDPQTITDDPQYGDPEDTAPNPYTKYPHSDSSDFIVNSQWIANDKTDFSGVWGVAVQPHFVNFTPNVLYYKHTSVIQLNYGRADFRNFQGDQLDCKCYIKGNKKIRQYTDDTTYTEWYTNNRAWCLFDLYTNKRYGLAVDRSRFVIQDWITLAAYCEEMVNSIDQSGGVVSTARTVFNADINEGKWSDHLNDICLAGYFTLPYYHQGKIRIGHLEPMSTEPVVPPDAPVFSDEGDDGTVRNIVFESNRSTLRYSMESDAKLPNQIKLNYDDELFTNQSRPLVLKDEDQQLRAGYASGDETARPVEKEYNAVGVTSLPMAARLARRILDLGPFEQGGLRNNFKIKFTTWSLLSDVMGLHPYSIIKVVSSTVNQFQERPGYPYEYFRVQKLTRLKNLQMGVEAQLYPRGYIADYLNWKPAPAVVNEGGTIDSPPADVSFTGVTATAGTVNFTLSVAAAPDPGISGVTSTGVTSTTATITWTTTLASSSQVQYGLTTSYGSLSAYYSTPVTSHSVTLTGLTPGTLYHYAVIST